MKWACLDSGAGAKINLVLFHSRVPSSLICHLNIHVKWTPLVMPSEGLFIISADAHLLTFFALMKLPSLTKRCSEGVDKAIHIAPTLTDSSVMHCRSDHSIFLRHITTWHNMSLKSSCLVQLVTFRKVTAIGGRRHHDDWRCLGTKLAPGHQQQPHWLGYDQCMILITK